MFARPLAALALFLAAALAAQAEPMRMFCTFDRSGDWVTDQFYFDIDAAGKATVVDPIVLYFEKKPVPAKVTENTAKKLSMTWTVVTKNRSGQVTRMAFRAAYLKGNRRIAMTAKPHGYGNSFNGRGVCQPTVNPLPTT
jgi:hypothetical protein